MKQTGEHPEEQRRFPRTRSGKGVFVFVHSESNRLGELLNVSRGGLAFRYLVEGNGIPLGCCQVDILIGQKSFWLPDLPVTMVADRADPSAAGVSFLESRIAALEFSDLSETQERQLASLLSMLETPEKSGKRPGQINPGA